MPIIMAVIMAIMATKVTPHYIQTLTISQIVVISVLPVEELVNGYVVHDVLPHLHHSTKFILLASRVIFQIAGAIRHSYHLFCAHHARYAPWVCFCQCCQSSSRSLLVP